MINWQNIDTVLLDMDGTLLDLHFDNYFWVEHLPRRFSEAHNVSLKEARNHIGKSVRELEGTLEWYCLDHWSELMQLDIPQLKREVSDLIQYRPQAELFLERLKAAGKKLVLITNAHPKSLEIKLECSNIDHWLDIIISSHEFKAPKEDALFWQRLENIEHFDKARTIFIDDTPRVLRSAQAFGIEHLVCITAPDSKKLAHDAEGFLGIKHFDEIMPAP
ncbi:MAG: HAD superfamily hydrolase (TIGR01509 family) [Flavobacteriales bacterium]